tara:strand:+ start:441 stop:1769 length:1329 start_codon:yes stop_codon:yes gene_type:complete
MISRRKFVQKTATGSAALIVGGMILPKWGFANSLGANDQINIAVIGIRSRAKALIKGIHAYAGAKVIYNCDVDDLIIEEHNTWCEKNIGYIPQVQKDFRKILEDKDIDAIVIATPDHLHAPIAIMALQAGKHVYVEKPCSHNLHENELLVAAQKKYGKKVQMGTQQRSAETSILAVKEINEGIIGNVFKGEAYYTNNRASIGKGKKIPVPSTLDWDLWQGTAPRQAYRDNVHPYNWHWFRDWGTGEVHNNGTHEIDICRWALGVDTPESVTSFGGKYTYDDDWEFPDNQQVTYQFKDDKFITWTGHSRGMLKPNRPGRGATIYGSRGSIMLSRNDYQLFDLDGKLIKTELEESKSATTDTTGEGVLDISHIANFLDSIKTDTKLHAPIADASISTMLCHLGNIAQNVNRSIKIDAQSGKIIKDKEAMSFWKREYEPGWEPKL